MMVLGAGAGAVGSAEAIAVVDFVDTAGLGTTTGVRVVSIDDEVVGIVTIVANVTVVGLVGSSLVDVVSGG
jgi:hypothetical protein